MNCPQCDKPMQNLGNVDKVVFTSNPPCWNETHVCHDCQIRKKVLVRPNPAPMIQNFDNYKLIF